MSSRPARPPFRILRLLAGVLLLPLLLAACSDAGPAARPGAAPARPREDAAVRFLRMADSALRLGRPEAAVTLAARGLEFRPADPALLRLYARALAAAGRPGTAADVWRKLLGAGTAPLADHLAYARALVESGQPELAARHLAGLEARFGSHGAYWNGRGIALAHARRFAEAVAAFERAVARDPRRASWRANLALAVALAGDPVKARVMLAPLADGLQSNPRIRHNLALVEVMAGRPQAARRLLRIDLDDRAVAEDLTTLLELTDPAGRGPILDRLAAPAVDPAPLPSPTRPPPASALALAPEDLERAGLPVGDWFLRLGLAADATTARRRWAELRQAHPQLLGDLRRLAGSDPGPQPLLAGPLSSRRAAEARCARLRQAGVDCLALRL